MVFFRLPRTRKFNYQNRYNKQTQHYTTNYTDTERLRYRLKFRPSRSNPTAQKKETNLVKPWLILTLLLCFISGDLWLSIYIIISSLLLLLANMFLYKNTK
jgi:hypothetical protein